MQIRMLGSLAALTLLAVMAPAAVTKEPTGFGKAKWGMSVAAVKKLYPKMEQLAEGRNLGSPPVGGPYVARYALWKEKIPGLPKPVDVELRFWKDQLWVYLVYFGVENEEAVYQALTKAHGPSEGSNQMFPTWMGPKATVMLERGQGRYGAYDNTISKDAQAWFIEKLKQGLGSRVQAQAPPAAVSGTPAGGTPAASPAAPATPVAGDGH